MQCRVLKTRQLTSRIAASTSTPPSKTIDLAPAVSSKREGKKRVVDEDSEATATEDEGRGTAVQEESTVPTKGAKKRKTQNK